MGMPYRETERQRDRETERKRERDARVNVTSGSETRKVKDKRCENNK